MPPPSQHRRPGAAPERAAGPSAPRARRALGTIIAWLAARLAALALGAAVWFAVLEARGGRALAIAGVLVLVLLAPFALGALVARVAARAGRRMGAARVGWALAAPLALGGAVALCAAAPREVGGALRGVAARDPEAGPLLGAAASWVGARLAPDVAPVAPYTPPRAPVAPDASAPAAAPSPARVATSAADAAVAATPGAPSSPARFASGDTSYTEPGGCDALADLADLAASGASAAAPSALRPTAEAIAARRYPDGLAFLRAQSDAQLATWFTGVSDFAGVVARFDTAVHEGSHIWSNARLNGRTQTYAVRGDLRITTRYLRNFARSEITTAHPDPAADSYARVYLAGQSGTQGFNNLLDEYNAYAHSLAARYCLRDQLAPDTRVSARDGVLVMMFYVATYLRLARTNHPRDYSAITADEGHRRLVLTVWDRAEYWLRRSADVPGLGVDDARAAEWAYAPDALAEIARLRAMQPAQAGGRDR